MALRGHVAGARPSGRARRLPWNLVALVALAVLVAGTAAALIAVSRSVGPVEGGGGLSFTRAVGATEYRIVDSLEGRTGFAVDATRPGGFLYAFNIENVGRTAVTLSEIPRPRDLWLRTDVRISDAAVQGEGIQPGAGRDVAVDAIRLEAGERRRLTVTFRWATPLCAPDEQVNGDVTVGAPEIEFRYRSFVFDKRRYFAMPRTVVFVCGPLPRPDGHWVRAGEARVPGR